MVRCCVSRFALQYVYSYESMASNPSGIFVLHQPEKCSDLSPRYGTWSGSGKRHLYSQCASVTLRIAIHTSPTSSLPMHVSYLNCTLIGFRVWTNMNLQR